MSTEVIFPRQHLVQNFFLIWLDASIDKSTEDCQNILTQLRSIVNGINVFTEQDEAVDFLTEENEVKAFLIVENTIGQHILPLIHDVPQLDAIYVFSENTFGHEQWTQEWIKIKGVFTDIKPICEALQQAAKQCNQDSIAMSFIRVSEETNSQNLNQLEPSFMYTQIFKEILIEMEHNEQSIKALTDYCRILYTGNTKELNIINDFEHNYRSNSPIWWYTRQCFTYQLLNRALRILDGDIIINMGFFIRDLHQQIQELHQKQADTYHKKSFTVYRGQGLMSADFEKLQNTKGGLMSFNNFLSTSSNRDVSLRFARSALTKANMVGILFQMSIDSCISSAPFAFIREVSYFRNEEEILFSMHSVFRIGEIIRIDTNHALYQVNLQLTADDDQQLRTLTERIRHEVVGGKGWHRLGVLLIKLSQFDKATELYNLLLKQTSDLTEKALYYNQLGYIKDDQGDYKEANEYYKKALQLWQETLPTNHHLLAISNNNIGLVYEKMGEYTKALSFHQKALEIFEKTLTNDHPDLATSYSNIGLVYNRIEDHSKALSSYEKALKIFQKILPPNHPLLATSYHNIADVYSNMGEYSKTLSYRQKALEIRQKTLPTSHPDLAQSYNNIGLVYAHIGEYSKALSSYEKALEIFQKLFRSNHPSLATSYSNIGSIYEDMKEYAKALSFHQKALEIFEKTRPLNHHLLAISCNNIGLVYKNLGDYSKALLFYEKALESFQKILPSNHSSLATSYNNIASVYNDMREYVKALSCHQKAFEIRQNILPSNHPDFGQSYNNIAGVYLHMEEYSKSLSYFTRALEIMQNSLPSNHPKIKILQNNIDYVKKRIVI